MIITNVFFTSDVECIPGEQVKIRAGVNSTVQPFTQWEKSNKGFFFSSFLFFPPPLLPNQRIELWRKLYIQRKISDNKRKSFGPREVVLICQ